MLNVRTRIKGIDVLTYVCMHIYMRVCIYMNNICVRKADSIAIVLKSAKQIDHLPRLRTLSFKLQLIKSRGRRKESATFLISSIINDISIRFSNNLFIH